MDDRTTRQPWAVEHYGFADDGPGATDAASQPAAAHAGSQGARRHRRVASFLKRGRLAVGGGVLALGLVAGAGGFAVAQADDAGQSVVANGHAHDRVRGPR
jgi:hypothetical protein